MSFYGNIVNYFSAAFKKFKFLNRVVNNEGKLDKESSEVEALLSQDVLTFDSTTDNYIRFIATEDENNNKTIDMQLNIDALRKDSTVGVMPQGEENYPSYYEIYQLEKDENGNSLKRGEIKYYAKYNSNNGNLYIPFIYFKEETE